MAIAAGDEVALIRLSTSTLGSRGNVLFGIVTDASSNCNVVFENGQYVEGIPPTSLDKITGQDSTDASVAIFSSDSPEYRSVIVRRYTRQTNGAGATTAYTLLRSLASGQMYEALTSEVTELAGV